MSGWIKLHRQLIEWEWYSDINTTRLFLHLVLIANHKDNVWRNIPIKRGQKLTSLIKLSEQTGLTTQKVRTALANLKSTNDITSSSSSQHTVFTVVNYELYQGETSETTNEQQTKNKQITTNKNEKNEKNEKNNIDWDDLKSHFNETIPNKNVSVINDKRKAHIRKMLKSTGKDIETLKAHIENAACSNQGFWQEWRDGNTDRNGKFWPPRDFDFYMQEKIFIKSLED